jgi:hypothetical protein
MRRCIWSGPFDLSWANLVRTLMSLDSGLRSTGSARSLVACFAPGRAEIWCGLGRKARPGQPGGTGPGAGLPASDRAWRPPHATRRPARPGGNMPLAVRWVGSPQVGLGLVGAGAGGNRAMAGAAAPLGLLRRVTLPETILDPLRLRGVAPPRRSGGPGLLATMPLIVRYHSAVFARPTSGRLHGCLGQRI